MSAPCCFVFSIGGCTFLTFIGILLKAQPIYLMQSIKHPDEAGDACFWAASFYAAIIIGIAYWSYHVRVRRLVPVLEETNKVYLPGHFSKATAVDIDADDENPANPTAIGKQKLKHGEGSWKAGLVDKITGVDKHSKYEEL